MRKFALALIVALHASMASAETYKIANWPDDLDQVQCSAWTHNPDGSWTQTAPIMVGSNTFTKNIFKGGREGAILDKHCGGSN